jgi:hypothetical protein
MAELRDRLWNDTVGPDSYEGKQAYQAAILDQYKLYVEMADRISQRRGLTNTFFLTLNTAILTTVGVFWTDRTDAPEWPLLFPLVAVLAQCGARFYLLRSYRLLNTAKFAVVGALEERLPASPYSRAEWSALGEGSDPKKYWPLTHLEKWVPLLFMAVYLAAYVTVVVS